VATPVMSPSSGDQPISVSITCATSGATIFYTVSNTPGTTPVHTGATPQGSTLIYAGTISVTGNASKTVKALGYKTGLTDSSIASATYNGQGGGGQ
jgi:Fn3 associated